MPGTDQATAAEKRVGRGVNYTLNMWAKLRRCFDHAQVELSNNVAENSMRPVALGRKNWLHVGSAKSGPKVAAILSVVESCRRLGIPVKDYLLAILPGMNRRKRSEIAGLTPAAGPWPASDSPWIRRTLTDKGRTVLTMDGNGCSRRDESALGQRHAAGGQKDLANAAIVRKILGSALAA